MDVRREAERLPGLASTEAEKERKRRKEEKR
jgi:hypothetical protein